MKLVIKEEINLIGEVRTSSYTVLTNPVTEYNSIPMSIGQAKGDLIVFKGPGEPVRFSAGSANGKVPMTDNTSPTGWTLGDGGGGGGASVVLHNGSGAQMLAGTVVYAVEADGVMEAYKADDVCDQRLYILNDDLADGEEGKASFVPGSVASVLCDTNEVIYGSPIRVSSNAPGLATATDGNATVGIALSGKDSGAPELVKVRLCENRTKKVLNKSGSSNMLGAVYTLIGDGTDGVPHAVLATKGKLCFGIQAVGQSANDSAALLKVQPGDEAVVRADSTEIRIGDWLVPSATDPGKVRNGSGYGIGAALENKVAGSSNLVKIKMYPLQYGYSPRAWWLPGGITEDQVLVAYQFVGRRNEEEALLNINNGTTYELTKSGTDVTWSAEQGFYIPGKWNTGLNNSVVNSLTRDNVYAAAFGYNNGATSGNYLSGGLGYDNYTGLHLRGMYGSGTALYGLNYPCIYRKSNSRVYISASAKSEGVLGGNWSDASASLWRDGAELAVTYDSEKWMKDGLNGQTFGQINWANKNQYVAFGMTAAVMFTRMLTAEEHLELAISIKALGGAG